MTMQHIIQSGCGYNVGHDFNRTSEPTLIDITDRRGQYVYGYIKGNPQSKLGFMRADRIRVQVQSRFIEEYMGG